MIARNKVLHVAAGFGVALLFGLLFGPGWGLLAALAAGAGKEALDACGFGVSDGADFNATAAGGALGMLAAIWL